MLWIEFSVNYDIPEELFYDGYQSDKNISNETPLMIWVRSRPRENIPEKLFYEGYQSDKDEFGRTPLMIWIEFQYRIKEIPKCLLYQGY